jgi:hypothetical protein
MLDAVANIFEVLKSHINEGNHKEAAIDLVHTLVDTQGVSPGEIRDSALMEDEEVREALIEYDDTVAEEDDGLDPWGDEYDNEEENEDY